MHGETYNTYLKCLLWGNIREEAGEREGYNNSLWRHRENSEFKLKQ